MQNFKLITFTLLVFFSTIIVAQDSTQVLDLLQITSRRPTPERLTETENTILLAGKKNEILRLSTLNANLASNNTRQIFARVPGISIWENDGSGLQVSVATRGLSPNRSWEFNTRQNGYDIASDIFGYPEAYYNPAMEAVEKIQVVRGAAALQFGPQFGGLLNYQLKREHSDKKLTFETQNSVGSFNMLSSFNAIGGNYKKWSYYAYNQSRSGATSRENSDYKSRNSHAFLQYALTEKTKISGEFTQMSYINQQSGGLTDVQFAQNPYQSVRNRNWFQVNWAIGNVNLDYKATQNLSFNLKVMALQGERNSVGFTAAPNVADTVNAKINQYNNRQLDLDTYTNYAAEARGLWQYEALGKKHNLAFGAKFYQSNTKRLQRGKGDTGSDFSLKLEGVKYPTNLDFATQNIAFFAENALKITKNLTFTHGVRYENIVSSVAGLATVTAEKDVLLTPQSAERNVILAAAGLQYRLKNTNFYGNISQAYRPVLYSDLITSNTTDVIDANLKDANGFNADLGYRGLIGEFLNFDASLFFVQYNNKIGTLRQFTNNDPTKSTYQFRTNLGKAQHKGAEIFVEFNPCKAFNRCKNGELSFFASLAFTDARYQDFKTTVIKGTAPTITITEGNLKNNKVENAPEQIHNLGVTYLLKGFSTTFQVRYSSDFFTDASNTIAPNATGTAGKIAAYTVADWSFKYQFLGKYSIQCSVNNVFDAVYATRRSGGYPGPGLLSGEARSFNFGVGCKF